MENAKNKSRKLYVVRNHANNGLCMGREVGYKARLLPRKIAMRIAKRLRKSGLFITVDAMIVNLTYEQSEYLDRRYA